MSQISMQEPTAMCMPFVIFIYIWFFFYGDVIMLLLCECHYNKVEKQNRITETTQQHDNNI